MFTLAKYHALTLLMQDLGVTASTCAIIAPALTVAYSELLSRGQSATAMTVHGVVIQANSNDTACASMSQRASIAS